MNNTVTAPTTFEPQVARVAMTPEATRMVARAGVVVQEAEGFVIDCKEMADFAQQQRREARQLAKDLDATRLSITEPLRVAERNTNGFFVPFARSAERAATIYGQKIDKYIADEQAKVDAERRRIEDENRKAREKAEQEAAAARAKADAEAAEVRRQAEAAEAARRKAEEEGNAKAAAKAAAEAAALNEKERQALERGEQKAQTAILAAAAPIVAPIEAPKVAGYSQRKNFVGQLAQGVVDDKAAIRLIAAALAERPELVAYLALDWKAINGTAKAQETAFNVPGLVAVNRPIGQSTGGK
jgi:FKBP-type peptidyl-prolyl cis-trans isomerase